MSWYRYKALAEDGRQREGRLEAASQAAAVQALSKQGMQPYSLSLEGESKGRWSRFGGFSLGGVSKDARRRKVWVMTRELAALLRAGLPLPNALDAIIQEQRDTEVRALLEDCREQVSSGKGLGQALAAHPQWFEPMYVKLVRAGELVGALDGVLLRLSQDMQRRERLKGRVRNAMAYPAFLVLVGTAVVSFLMIRVVPTILVILDDLTQATPLPTKILLFSANAFRVAFWPLTVLLIALIVAGRMLLRRPEYRRAWDRFCLRLPLFGPLALAAATTRFARTLSSLLRAGIPLLSGLGIAGGMVNNRFLEGMVSEAEAEVERGRPLAEALGRSGVFPASLVYLIRAGEVGGELPLLLDEAADLFEEQLERRSERFVTLLEPLLIGVLGGVVLLIVLAILLPIFEMNQAAGS